MPNRPELREYATVDETVTALVELGWGSPDVTRQAAERAMRDEYVGFPLGTLSYDPEDGFQIAIGDTYR